MVYGTVDCEKRNLAKIKAALAFPDFHGEFHWSEAEKHSGDHERFIRAVMGLISDNKLAFRCIVVKAEHMRHREYNQNDSDLGLEKYIYRKLLNQALNYATDKARFHVTLDAGREGRFPTATMKKMLNAGFQKESPFNHAPFVAVHVVESHKCRLIQAADVLSGAVAWVRNRRYVNRSKSAEKKEKLVQTVAGLARLPVVHEDAKRRGIERRDYRIFHYQTFQRVDSAGFTIWHFDLTGDYRKQLEAISEHQLKAIPTAKTLFRELPDLGYRVRLACPYCNTNNSKTPPDEKFNNQAITRPYRTRCTECGNRHVALLNPDPRDVPLLDRTRAARS